MSTVENFEMATPGRSSVAVLLRDYSRILAELREHGVVRSVNNPVADYAEYLVVRALGLRLAAKSTKGYNAVSPEGETYEIKARRPTQSNKSRMLGVIRDCEAHHFDYLVGVLFKEPFEFDKACLVPIAVVIAQAKYRAHVNGHILELRDSLWRTEGVRDISGDIRRVISAEAAANSACAAG
jgi:hypothetical protein